MRRPLALAIIALLVMSAPAGADYDPLASGTTKLTFDKSFLSFLKKNGVKIEAKSPAKRQGPTVTLPVLGGEMDPLIEKGTIEQEGIILFKRGSRSVPLKKVTLKTKSTPIQAKVGGSQLKVAKAESTSVTRSGFGTVFKAKGLTVAAKLATRLNKKLRLGKTFAEGQLIGSLRSTTQPRTVVILDQGRATLAVDSAFFAKLTGLFVSLNPISPAELAPGPVLSFPIIRGGVLAPNASEGTLRTGGSFELLQQGAGQVFEHELWLDLAARTISAEVNVQPTPAFPGKLGRIGALDANLAAATISSNPKARTISISGAPLTLQAQTAATFNEAFAEKKDVFKAGEAFGTFSFTAQGQ